MLGGPAEELAATTVIALPLQEASSKVRDSGPGDTDGPDRDLPVWAGVLPIRTLFGTPIDDPAAARPIDTPAHVCPVLFVAATEAGVRASSALTTKPPSGVVATLPIWSSYGCRR